MFNLTVLDKAIIGTTLAITVSVVIAVHNGFENQTKKYKEDLSRAKTPKQVRLVKQPPYTVESYRQQTLRNVAISPQPPLSTRRSKQTRKSVRFAPSEIREFKRETSDKGASFTSASPLPAVSERPESIIRNEIPDDPKNDIQMEQFYNTNMALGRTSIMLELAREHGFEERFKKWESYNSSKHAYMIDMAKKDVNFTNYLCTYPPEDLGMKAFYEANRESPMKMALQLGIGPRFRRWALLEKQKYDERILHVQIADSSGEGKKRFIQKYCEKCIQEREELQDELSRDATI